MKHFSQPSILLLLLLVGRGSSSTDADTAVTAANSWSLEMENAVGDQGTENKIWCASPTGDLAFGPVQGADTSAPDASIWAVAQAADQFLVQLRLPSTLDYSCRLETASTPWKFSLPLSTLSQDGYSSGDIKCHGPWHWSGVHPEDIPPTCRLFDADDYAIASVVISSFTLDHLAPSPATADAPNPTPAPGVGPTGSISPDVAADAPLLPSPTTAPASFPPLASSPSPSPSPAPTAPAYAPRPGRKLLCLS